MFIYLFSKLIRGNSLKAKLKARDFQGTLGPGSSRCRRLFSAQLFYTFITYNCSLELTNCKLPPPPQVNDNLHFRYFTIIEVSTILMLILRTFLAAGTEIIVDVLRHVAV